ncbi:MAG: phytoene desaturase [Bradyrhizobiaceae bacterium]|nr:MAG: phytoene desaturase [Bradyrhizobiaceae bacterium]
MDQVTFRKSDKPVIVIGSGLGGLASAVVAAARGHSVAVYDKNDWLGGKAAVLEEGGFRFDMGPTILTVPSVLRRIFEEAGETLEDWLPLIRLDPQWRCFFGEGDVLDLVEDVPEMGRKAEAFSGKNGLAQGYEKFLRVSEHLHDVSERFFFWKSVEDIRDTMNIRENMNPATLRDVLSLRMGRSVASTIRGMVPDERVSQMLDHFVQYVGSSPFASPAVLCSIAHMQTSGGVWYPVGGTRAVAEQLRKLGEKLGVTYHTNSDVAQIVVEDGVATGIRLVNGDHVAASAVISNMDSLRTYAELVGGDAAKHYEKAGFEPACSGVVLYLGLNKRYDHLLHHDFVFSDDAHEEFDAIYKRGEPAPDPTCYIAAPSGSDPSVAPEGGEALYVLVHTPYLRPHHDWSKMFPQYRQVILDKLKRTAGLTDIEDRIVFERHLTPQDIHDRYKVLNGAIYGLASHGKFTGAFKPGNRSRFVKNLYLAGGAAHPGPGMPMVMMSGWIAADALDSDHRSVLAAS